MIEDIAEIIGLRTKMGVNALQDRIFAEVILDELGNVSIDGLIVGDSVSDSIRQGHVAGTIGPHQSGHAKHRVFAKYQGVEKFVVHAAIDHVHALEPADRLHVDDAAIDDEIAALNQLDAHLLGKEAVLEISAVVNAGREQNRLRIGGAARREAPQNPGEFRWIMVDRQNFVRLKRVGKSARHHDAVLEHIGDPARRAHVIFKNEKLARLRVANQIDSADMRVDAVRNVDADHLAMKVTAGIDE